MLLIALCFPAASFGQEAPSQMRFPRIFSPASLLSSTKTNTFRLLDPSRFAMTHSYAMSFQSGGQGSSMLGRYTNTLKYQISKQAQLRVNVGLERLLLNTSPAMKASGGVTRVVPGFDFLYRPNARISIYVGYGVSQPYEMGSACLHPASPWEQGDASAGESLDRRD